MDETENETSITLQNPDLSDPIETSKIEEDVKRIESGKATSRVVLTEWARLYAEAKKAATTDFLTGVFNRQFFMGILERDIRLSQRIHADTGVLFGDIDDFKGINDEYGHDVGDSVLKEVADRLKETLRESDPLARIGGEEFAAVLVGAKKEDVQKIAERARVSVHEIRIEDHPNFKVNISIGATNLEQRDDPDSILKRADQAMYEAKRTGKNKVNYVEAKKENG